MRRILYFYLSISTVSFLQCNFVRNCHRVGWPKVAQPCSVYPMSYMIQQIFERNHSFLIPTHPPPERDPCRGALGTKGQRGGNGAIGTGLLKGLSPAKSSSQMNVWWMNKRRDVQAQHSLKNEKNNGLWNGKNSGANIATEMCHYALIHASMPFMLPSQKGRHADSFQILGWVLQGIVWADVSFHYQNVLRVFQVREKPFLSIRS